MQKIVRYFFPLFVCLWLSGQVAAQPPLLPGQKQRQTLSGGLLYQCFFDQLSDANNDGWPDYWTRKEGFDNGIPFPTHLVIGRAPSPNPFGNFVLRMNMEGGAAAVFSPKIPVRAGMAYTLSAYVETSTLVFNEVSLIATFYGSDTTKPIRTIESKKIRNTGGWQKLSIGPVPAEMPNVKSVAICLLVMPTDRQDFRAIVNFANVEIRESPVISLEMANHLFFTTRELEVRCQFRGLDPAQHSVEFILEDPFGRIIRSNEVDLMIGNHPAKQFVVTSQNAGDVIHGTATWRNLPIQSPGFYRIRVATPASYIQTLRLPPDQVFDDPLGNIEPLTFVVMPPGSYLPGGEFGWTLDGWTLDEIAQASPTLSQSGLSHLKLPIWLSPDASPQQREALRRLCSGFSEQRVNLIGLLDPVPKSVQSKIPFGYVDASAVLGNDPNSWGESLQPTLQTLSLLVKDWQWTSDTDQSLISKFFDSSGQMTPAGRNRFLEFQRAFDQNRFGFGIGMTWNWFQDVPNEPLPIPNFSLNFPIDPSIAPEDAASFLAGTSAAPFQRRVSVSPLPADDYTLRDRITHFVRTLVFMKAAGMETISLTAPKDEQIGVLRQNGSPNELYLPWRTTATLLSGCRLMGSITLPNRSRNYCFEGIGGKCMMVVWNDGASDDQPVEESLYLGDELETIDVWGKHLVPEQLGNNQMIPVKQTPTFVTGLNINVTRFRLSMQTDVKTISAKPRQVNAIPFSFRNGSSYPTSIQITPEGPRPGDWTITPPSQTFNVEAGLTEQGSFDLMLMPRADTGRRLFQYNVKITGTEAVAFDVYDEMMIGDPEVSMEFVSRLTEKGDIEVIQVFINNSEKVLTYNCRLTIPQRQFQQFRITRQGFGRVEHVYTIPRGQALLDAGVTEVMLMANPVNDGSGILGEPMVYTIPLVMP